MLAAVDIGSLTVRLLIGEVTGGRVVPHLHRRVVTRLGMGLYQNRGLLPDVREQTLDALDRFVIEIDRCRVTAISVFGTEALRRAANAELFIHDIRQRCGLKVVVLDGDHEARLSTRGVLAALDPRPDRCLVVDIGGGSTEFALLEAFRPLWRTSLPLGVVRLAAEPAGLREGRIVELLATAKDSLGEAGLLDRVLADDCILVGTAGTMTTLAAMELQMTDYDWRRVNNLVLTGEVVGAWHDRLHRCQGADLSGLPGLEPGREDLIGPGVAIVVKMLEIFGKTTLKISDFGLLEGALLELAANRVD